MRGRTSLGEVKTKKKETEKTETVENKTEEKIEKKRKYYKVIVNNNDMIDGDPGIIDFFANRVRVIIEPGYPVLLGETAYENLTKRCVQTRYRFVNEGKDLVKYPFRRFPVTTLEEMELTEAERVKVVAQIKKDNEKKKEEENKSVA